MDHGYYSISPVLLIDYYNSHNYRINSIFMFGYNGAVKSQVTSPDCRITDNNKWIKECARDRDILLVCIATKLDKASRQEEQIQDNSGQKEEERRHGGLSKQQKIKKLADMVQSNEIKGPVALYGIGQTQRDIVAEFVRRESGLEKQLYCIYDRDERMQGKTLEYYRHRLPVLDIRDIRKEPVKTIVIASVSWHTEEIYERLKYLEDQGIGLVKLREISLDVRNYMKK